jgi:pimeloyl-ACP methyl ester carboxylesterase
MPESFAMKPAPDSSGVSPSPRKKLRKILLAILLLLLIGGLALSHPLRTHLPAMSVLLRLSDPKATGMAVRFAGHPVQQQEGTAITPVGSLRYRLYIPQNVTNPPGLVLLHGVQRLGIEEPRLINFAQALAGTGMEVMTPELKDLADYHVSPPTIDQIGMAAVILSNQLHQRRVGTLGLSFAGGLALLAATRPEYANNMAFVVSIGGHDDLARVSRFFATNTIERPDGSVASLEAHEYGVLVLAYSHIEDFFSAPDVPFARDALRLWLHEQPDRSRESASHLSAEGKAKLEQILHHRDQIRQELLDEIKLHGDEMAAVSPRGRLGALTVPALLLHGSGDAVIPTTETQWLAKDVPPQALKNVLISPALGHVDVENTVTIFQKWDLVHFVAQIIDREDQLRR